ncbi:thiF family protein [Colletotrichum tofieldiae]|nr:thiF family protein [Colletotrichum tofieldiae]
MEEQTQPQDKPAQETATPSNTIPAQETVVPHHPLPNASNGFDPSMQAAPMGQVLPEALQGSSPEACPQETCP